MSKKDVKSSNEKQGSPQLRNSSTPSIKVKEATEDMKNTMGIFIKIVNLTIDINAKINDGQRTYADDIEIDGGESRSVVNARVSDNGATAVLDRSSPSRSPGGEHLKGEYQASDSKGGKSPKKSFVQRMTGKLRNSFRRHKKDSLNAKATVFDGPSSSYVPASSHDQGKIGVRSDASPKQFLRPEMADESDTEQDGEHDDDSPAAKRAYAESGFDKIVNETITAEINPACGLIAVDLIRMANDLDRKYAGNRAAASVFLPLGTNYLRGYLSSKLDYTRFRELADKVVKAVQKEEIGKQVVLLCKVVEEVILISGQVGQKIESIGDLATEYFAENLAPRVAEEGGLAIVVRHAGENAGAEPV